MRFANELLTYLIVNIIIYYCRECYDISEHFFFNNLSDKIINDRKYTILGSSTRRTWSSHYLCVVTLGAEYWGQFWVASPSCASPDLRK